jgi:hypothetical protein
MSRRGICKVFAVALGFGAFAQSAYADPIALTDAQLDQASAGAFLTYNPIPGGQVGLDPPLTLYGANNSKYITANGGVTYTEYTTLDGISYTPVGTVWTSQILYFFDLTGLVYGVLSASSPTLQLQYWDGGYAPPPGVLPYQTSPARIIGQLAPPLV